MNPFKVFLLPLLALAAKQEATPEQARRLADEVSPLARKWADDPLTTPVTEVVEGIRNVMGRGWMPGPEYKEAIDQIISLRWEQ